MRSVGFVSAIIYTGTALVAAGLFILATLSSKYTNVERFGGAGWVFFLSMIILMPVVTSIVKKKLGGD